MKTGKIGIFDSGYGGLTVYKAIQSRLPDYDLIYLGDNARAPYGGRSFEVVYTYTREAVMHLFELGCELVILACNTASAKALRTIQQKDLGPNPRRRVLGVIRPCVEVVPSLSFSKNVGLLATSGTVRSDSYRLELAKLAPEITLFQQSCPMWVPLIENGEQNSPAADYFVDKYLDELNITARGIDTLILGCTHYPILAEKVRQRVGPQVTVIDQSPVVADKLVDYLSRHPEIERRLGRGGNHQFFTTEQPELFNVMASVFSGREVQATRLPW